MCYQREVDTSGADSDDALAALPQAETKTTTQKVTGFLTTGKYLDVFNCCFVDSTVTQRSRVTHFS